MTTSKPIQLNMDLPTSSVPAGRAKTSASPVRELASKVLVQDSGQSLPESLARYDLVTRSWRTYQISFLETVADGFSKYSETWPRSGMTANGIAYQLPVLALRTYETVSGSLPTPSASHYGTNQGGSMGRTGKVRPSLQTMAKQNRWPTPCARDRHSYKKLKRGANASPGGTPLGVAVHEQPLARMMMPTPTVGDSRSSGSRNTENSRAHHGVSLTDAVRGDGGEGRMFPTPAAHEGRLGYQDRTSGKKGTQESLTTYVMKCEGREPKQEWIGGQLNPAWVEWLMGYPTGWTDLKESATPSCRK